MPHVFATISISSSSAVRVTHEHIQPVCADHGGTLKQVWHDRQTSPKLAYALIHHPDPDGAASALKQALQADQVVALHDPSSAPAGP